MANSAGCASARFVDPVGVAQCSRAACRHAGKLGIQRRVADRARDAAAACRAHSSSASRKTRLGLVRVPAHLQVLAALPAEHERHRRDRCVSRRPVEQAPALGGQRSTSAAASLREQHAADARTLDARSAACRPRPRDSLRVRFDPAREPLTSRVERQASSGAQHEATARPRPAERAAVRPALLRARRARSCRRCRRSSRPRGAGRRIPTRAACVLTKNGLAAKSICGFGVSKLRLAGISRCSSASTVLMRPGDAGRGIEMPDVALHRADRAVLTRAAGAAERLRRARRSRWDRRAAWPCRAPRHSRWLRGIDSRYRLRGRDDFGLPVDARRGVAHLLRAVVVDGRAEDHGADRIAIGERIGRGASAPRCLRPGRRVCRRRCASNGRTGRRARRSFLPGRDSRPAAER